MRSILQTKMPQKFSTQNVELWLSKESIFLAFSQSIVMRVDLQRLYLFLTLILNFSVGKYRNDLNCVVEDKNIQKIVSNPFI